MDPFDEWAEYYDFIYGKFMDDIGFYTRESKKSRGKVLEVGCGTGRVYLELLKAGIDAYGIDISGKMLEILKKKAKNLSLSPKIYKADMKTFRLNQKFSLIIVPARAFLHNLTTEDQIKALKNFRRHLAPGGRLILNFFCPSHQAISDYGKWMKETVKSDRKYARVYKTYFADEANQIIEVQNFLEKDGRRIWKSTFRIALIYKKEFELLLRQAGFKRWKLYGGFEYKPFKSPKQEMIWVVRK